jgi:hypothetical protein
MMMVRNGPRHVHGRTSNRGLDDDENNGLRHVHGRTSNRSLDDDENNAVRNGLRHVRDLRARSSARMDRGWRDGKTGMARWEDGDGEMGGQGMARLAETCTRPTSPEQRAATGDGASGGRDGATGDGATDGT